jgi:hypothetical protein
MKRSQLRYLAFLVFKRGGVSGAIRRIVYGWKGIFTTGMIYGKLLQKYPLLVPSDYQLFDCLERMVKQNRIVRVLVNACDTFYKLAPRQLWFRFS